MSKKQKQRNKNKTSETKKNAGLFIIKKTDSIGRNYFVDREGKKRKRIQYESQWSINGRVSKSSFERTLREIERFEITDVREARLIANDFEILRRAEPLRKKELEILASETRGSQLFFRATDTIRDAIAGGAIIKIQTPTNKKFQTVTGVQAMELAHRFIDSVNDSVQDINDSGETVTSPLIQFNFEHDIDKNIFYLDFKNVSGFDDFILLQQLIKDNFEA
jgi:hypothetical protein